MRGRLGVAGVLVSLVAGPPAALALDVSRYQPEERFGGWTVWCDREDDMGNTTYFDCVVQSAASPAVVLSSLAAVPAISLADPELDGVLVLSDRRIAFAECPAGLCPVPTEADGLGALFADGGTLETDAGAAELSAEGLEDAVDFALDRLN